MWMDQSPGTSCPFSVFCGLGTWFWNIGAKAFCLGPLDGLFFINLTDCFLNPFRLAYTTLCSNEFCVITVV